MFGKQEHLPSVDYTECASTLTLNAQYDRLQSVREMQAFAMQPFNQIHRQREHSGFRQFESDTGLRRVSQHT